MLFMSLPELLWDTLSINFRYEPFQDLSAYIGDPNLVAIRLLCQKQGGGVQTHTQSDTQIIIKGTH